MGDPDTELVQYRPWSALGWVTPTLLLKLGLPSFQVLTGLNVA